MTEPRFLTRVATESDAEAIALVAWDAFQAMIGRLRPLAIDDKQGFLDDTAQRARGVITGGQGPQMKWYVVVPAAEPETIAVIARWERIENACEKPFEPSPTAAFGGPPQVDFFNKMHFAHRVHMGSRPHYILHLLATQPRFQGQGAGSTVLRYLTKMADDEGLPAYVEAAPGSAEVYKHHGWTKEVERLVLPAPRDGPADPPDAPAVEICLIREPAAQTGP